ncbi:MAG: DUF481 domain-containing protein [endosymbiont of Galathealinum brachiosum]|uniref:DUF481 domain-containing protein n=1 Tax=endosymbiont of Galathealinum brachiosum TaxID=2200906 RepID=A0A370DD80_9GAMM|nr:MAG: DUF481 domain-containing protein [endosymbiont of Galathealinum brachiosum]
MYKKIKIILPLFGLFFLNYPVFAEDEPVTWKPSATEFDWVQLTSGEWLKGEIKSMYSESIEFDSDKLDLLNIDLEDVKYLQTFLPARVNIENIGEVTGVLNISKDLVTITQGETVKEYDVIELVSFTPSGNREIDLWAIKFTLGLDLRKGNTEQVDFTSGLNAKRRTSKSRFILDYIGNISKTDAVSGELEETVNNHRLNSNLDKYVTRNFFYTPVFAEYFEDAFQNIENRLTVGVGVGYTIINEPKTEWRVSGGPSYVSTEYVSVLPGEDIKVDSASLALSTSYEVEINNKMDFIYKYNIQISEEEAGGYTHHMIATFENELTGDLDLNISLIWDRINSPVIDDQSNAPEKDDLRFMLGISYSF